MFLSKAREDKSKTHPKPRDLSPLCPWGFKGCCSDCGVLGGGSGIQGGNTATGTKEPRDGVELGWILVFPNNTMGLLGDVPCFYLPQNLTLRVAEKAIPSFATVRQEMGTENKDFCVPCR